MKQCCTCKEEKPTDQFGACRSNSDGLQRYCKHCGKQRYAAWRSRNLDAARRSGRERQRAYAEKNPEKVLEAVRKYQAENPEVVKASRRKWRVENPDKAREGQNRRSRNYRVNNLGKVAARSASRRAALTQRACLLQPGDEAKIKAIYGFAEYMTEKFGKPYHVDHIVPLHGKTCSGLHVPGNLRVVPAQLNLSKGAKIDYELVPHAFRSEEI